MGGLVRGGVDVGTMRKRITVMLRKTNKLFRVLERAQAFVTKGDEPVTVRSEKIHVELEKAGADPDFVRYMISREDLDGEYYERVFGGEDSDSDMDVSDDNM